jgi:subtilisin family serine protease
MASRARTPHTPRNPNTPLTHRTPRSSQAVVFRAAFDTLEPRRLFAVSAVGPTVTPWAEMPTVSNVVPLKFQGVTYQAVVGKYNVLARPGVDFNAVAAREGFADVRELGGSGFYSFSTTRTPAQMERWARASAAGIEAVSPVHGLNAQRVANDTFYASDQYYLDNSGQLIPNPATVPGTDISANNPRKVGLGGADINVERAWDITTGNPNQIVAIIDSGLDVGHGDLAANIFFNPGEQGTDANGMDKSSNGIDDDGNGVADDINGYDFGDDDADLTDGDGHGTAVAGNVAAVGNNNRGIAGVSWSTKLMGVKVFGERDVGGFDAFNSIVIRALNYIVTMKQRGFDIVAANASLGGPSLVFDPVIGGALRRVEDAGIVFVAAAGNDTIDNDRLIDFPTRYSKVNLGSIAVAATDNQDRLANFTNFGASTVQVAAPGVSIFTTYSRVAPGATFTDPDNGDTYVNIDGTSFSSPIVAGVVALAKAARPDATPIEIVDAITRGSDRIAALDGLTPRSPRKTSFGRVDAYNTLRILLNRVGGTNTTLAGSWRGNFGGVDSYVYGTAAATVGLDFLTSSLTPTGAAVVESTVREDDARLLQSPTGDGRAAFRLVSDRDISFDFDFSAGTRRLSLYAADTARERRTQTVQIIDTDTGVVLQSVPMARFDNGQYLSFDLVGRVSLKIVAGNGGATLSGLFVDNAPSRAASAVSSDTLTGGNWMYRYGELGFVLPGVTQSLPSLLSLGTNATTVVGKAGRDAALPELLNLSRQRSSGVFTASSAFTFSVNVGGTLEKSVSFYTHNTSSAPRGQRYELLDSAGNLLSSTDVAVAPRSGTYVTFNILGAASVRVSSMGGGDASVAGVFFDSKIGGELASDRNGATLVGSSTTLGGRWRGTYGSLGNFVYGASATFPSVVTNRPVPTGTSFTSVLNSNTRAANAVQNPNTLVGNLVGYLGTRSNLELPLSFAPGNTVRMTAYFVDFDKRGRGQQVELVDADTNEVVSSIRVRDFASGVSLTWEVSGNIKLRLTRVDGPSAVLSALFFD